MSNKNRISQETAEKVTKILQTMRQVRGYVPEVATKLNSKSAATFVNQVFFWWQQKNRKPFYKYQMPCGGFAYAIGDSWAEELSFTKSELRAVLEKVATKVSGKKEALEVLKKKDVKSLVVYYIDKNRLGWYYFNEAYFIEFLGEAIDEREEYQMSLSKEYGKPIYRDGLAIEPDEEYEDSDIENDEDFNPQVSEHLPSQDFALSNTEQTHNNIKNGENEKDNPDYVNEYFDSIPEKEKPTVPKKPKSEEVKIKQRGFAEMEGNKMPLDFLPDESIIIEAHTLGYKVDDIRSAMFSFRFYYTEGKGKYRKHLDWNRVFIDKWLENAYQYGHIERNGQIRKVDANTERLTELQRKATTNSFDEVGTRDYYELAEKAREYRARQNG